MVIKRESALRLKRAHLGLSYFRATFKRASKPLAAEVLSECSGSLTSPRMHRQMRRYNRTVEEYEILRQIARDRALRGGSGLIKGAYTCVFFADLSLSLARHLYWRLCVPVAPRQPRQWSPSGFDATSLFQRSMTTCSSKRV